MLRNACILGDPQSQGQGAKSEVVPNKGEQNQVAASPLPSQGPKRERKCYATPAFVGIPNAKRGEQNQKWSPTKGNKI